jgi:hypothetical protein
MNEINVKIGDKVKESPVGTGEITGITQAGYPQVNHVAVSWLVLEDGTKFRQKPSNEVVISPRLMTRLHTDGTIDEVITRDEAGECNFHMEQMDDFQWWMRFYSTKASPLPRELIVNIGPSGAIQSFDPTRNYEDEVYTPPEYRTLPENITHEVDHFIRYFGMQRLLHEMIAQTERTKRDEKTNWPDRDTNYLDKLVEDLTATLKNYEDRYPGEPDVYTDETPPKENTLEDGPLDEK